MRVFVTGATGFIGSAIAQDLLTSGHQVLGLSRNGKAAELLARSGAEVHHGELTDTASLAAGARACDGVIHTAFIHDFSQYAANAEIDRSASDDMARALEDSGKPLVAVSVTTLLAPGRSGTEEDVPVNIGIPRAASEVTVLAAADRGVRASVVRLPASVHGMGDRGFVHSLIGIARRAGVAAYIGDGTNRWPAVHRMDAARLFRLALESAAPGTQLHAVAEKGVPMREIAETIGIGLGIPVRGITAEEAPAHFDWMARFAAIDNPISSERTSNLLGWRSREAGLLMDMRSSDYFS